MFEGPAELKAGRHQRGSRNRLSTENRDVNVEGRARLPLMDLKSQASDDGVRNLLARQNAAEREERRLLALVHLSPQPVPLAIE